MLPVINTPPIPDIPLTPEVKKEFPEGIVRNSVATLAILVSRQNPLLSTYYAPGSILGGENVMVSKTGKAKEKKQQIN